MVIVKTDRMLERAEDRVSRHGWRNVGLVRKDAAEFVLSASVRGILSTFARWESPLSRGVDTIYGIADARKVLTPEQLKRTGNTDLEELFQ